MRTKILLLSAAALVAGVVASQAQSNVYSANIVGYVNTTLPTNSLTLIQNPLNNNGSNTLNGVVGSVASGSIAYVWNGAGYDTATKPKSSWSPDLPVPNGKGFFVQRQGAVGTNTFVGSVVLNVGQSVTNPLTAGVLTLVGSALPVTGTLNTSAALGLSNAPQNSILYKWNGSGYDTITKPKSVWSPDVTINVGESFFIKPSSNFNWIQSLSGN